MTSLPDRQYTVTLVDDAQRDGARLAQACDVLGVSVRTYHRWKAPGVVRADRRPEVLRAKPRNGLSESERDAVVALCNALDYRSRPPAYIVADQADQGRYLASESTFYRVLRDYGQRHHRGRGKAP
ncbi:transposase, IS3 family protein, partial [Alcanivorax sp. 521-1]|nr:transposase, IS3 family protein [Alloalcanivorax profundimaris]